MSVEIILWIDPVCPYSRYAWKWLQSLHFANEVQLELKLISLALLNEKNEASPKEYRAPWAESLKIGRILCAIDSKLEKKKSIDLIDKFMNIWHNIKIRPMDNAIKDLLGEQLEQFYTEMNNLLWDKQLRKNTDASQIGIQNHGGSPVIRINNRNFYGPRFTDVPKNSLDIFKTIDTLTREKEFFGLSKNPD